MSKLALLFYICIVLYVWINAISELMFSDKHNIKTFSIKIVFAPIWILCIFSEAGRKHLFNFTKDANL